MVDGGRVGGRRVSTDRDAIIRRIHHDFSTQEESDTSDIYRTLDELVTNYAPLASPDRRQEILDEVRARIDGLGPLHEFATDPSVSEIMVNPTGQVWVERAGVLCSTGRTVATDEVEHLLRRLAAQGGRRIDLRTPSVDVRLADGSRLHGIIPPLAVDGPCMTIRRFVQRRITLDDLCEPAAAQLLNNAVERAKTVIVAGATSSGKTTLLNALGSRIAPDTRIITIEDAAELNLGGDHIVRLETRAGNEGVAEVGIRQLIRHALRMRPDRIICGEMRGAEALDLVQAMNTGHVGSMSTVHANTPADALRRIETMMLMGDADLPLAAVREQLASCIDLVVMMARSGGGERRVMSISEVPAAPTDRWTLEPVYDFSEAST